MIIMYLPHSMLTVALQWNNELHIWRLSNWRDGECLIIWMDVGGFEGSSCAMSEVAGTQTEPCSGVIQRAVGQGQIYEGILYGRGVVFLALAGRAGLPQTDGC